MSRGGPRPGGGRLLNSEISSLELAGGSLYSEIPCLEGEVRVGGGVFHVTITHDALDLNLQPPLPPLDRHDTYENITLATPLAVGNNNPLHYTPTA